MTTCCEYWKEVWERKGKTQIEDLRLLDGFENSPMIPEEVAKWIIKRLDIKKTDKVLEVGCGAGMIGKYISPYCDYTGIDYSESLVQKHILLLKNQVIVAEANDIPFEDKHFDKSFSYSVFHYFPDKEYTKQVIDEMKRVTKEMIYIGDLPLKSKRKEHQLFFFSEFEYDSEYDMKYCNNERFNVRIKIEGGKNGKTKGGKGT
jgi:SAM-dependent methyltransferase